MKNRNKSARTQALGLVAKCAFLSLVLFVAACGNQPLSGSSSSTNSNDKDAQNCEFGIPSANGKGCVNPPSCEQHTDCLEDWMCQEGTCKPLVSCEGQEPGFCAGGLCIDGACVNPKKCRLDAPTQSCSPGFACVPVPGKDGEGKCEANPAELQRHLNCRTNYWVKEGENSVCGNRPTCTDEQRDCMDGYACTEEGVCKSKKTLEDKCSKEKEGGIPDYKAYKCVNPETCEDNCLKGYSCEQKITGGGTVSKCKLNPCSEEGVCEEGVCKPQGEAGIDGVIPTRCVEPETCKADKECKSAKGHTCFGLKKEEAKCQNREDFTKEHCTGKQTSKVEDLVFTCVSAESCTAHEDCVGDELCNASGKCEVPKNNVACMPDAQEGTDGNNEKDKATTGAVEFAGLTLCKKNGKVDVDWFKYEVQTSNRETTLVKVVVTLDHDSVGRGPIEAQLHGEQEIFVEAVNKGSVLSSRGDTYEFYFPLKEIKGIGANSNVYVKITAKDQKLGGAGIKYNLSIEEVTDGIAFKCFNAKKIEYDTIHMGNTFGEKESKGFGVQCGSTFGGKPEEINDNVWLLEIPEDKDQYVTLTVQGMPNGLKDPAIVIYEYGQCAKANDLSVTTTCRDSSGEREVYSAIFEKGKRYAVVVTSANKDDAGSYSLKATKTATVCESDLSECIEGRTLKTCDDNRTETKERSCICKNDGSGRGYCVAESGKKCGSGIYVDNKTPFNGRVAMKDQTDTSRVPEGSENCGGFTGNSVTAVELANTHGPDAHFRVKLEPGEILSGMIDNSLNKAVGIAAYLVDDGHCPNDKKEVKECVASFNEKKGTNTGGGSNANEPIFYQNKSGGPETLNLIVDTYGNSHAQSALFNVRLEVSNEVACTPKKATCAYENRVSATCNSEGTAYSETIVCPPAEGCDKGTGKCNELPGDTCQTVGKFKPLTLKANSKGEFRIENQDFRYAYNKIPKPADCGADGHSKVFAHDDKISTGGYDFVYAVETKEEDEVIVFEVTPEGSDSVFNPVIWVADDVTCGAGAEAPKCSMYVNNDARPGKGELLEFAPGKKGTHYIVVSAHDEPVNNEREKLRLGKFSITGKVGKPDLECVGKKGKIECDSSSSKLVYCTNIGLKKDYPSCDACSSDPVPHCSVSEGKSCFDPLIVNRGPAGDLMSGSIQLSDKANMENNITLQTGRVGDCVLAKATSDNAFAGNKSGRTTGNDIIYAIKLKANELLTLDLSGISGNGNVAYFLEDCLNLDTCSGLRDLGQKTASYHNNSDSDKTIYIVFDQLRRNDYFRKNVKWKITSASDGCAPGGTRCVEGNSKVVEVCNQEGTPTELDCPDRTTCKGGACSFAPLSQPLDIGTGAFIYVDSSSKDLAPVIPPTTSSACSELANIEGKEYVVKVNVQAGNVILVKGMSGGRGNDTAGGEEDEKPAVYISKEGGNLAGTCVGGALSSSNLYSSPLKYAYKADTTGYYYVVLTSEKAENDEPYFYQIEVIDNPCANGDISCTDGKLQVCQDYEKETVTICQNKQCNATKDGCETPKGDVYQDAVVLPRPTTAGETKTASYPPDLANASESLVNETKFKDARYSGSCLWSTTTSASGGWKLPNGAEVFYSIELKEGEILDVANNLNLNTNIYLVDAETKDCVVNGATYKDDGDFYFQAPKDGKYYLVVDSNAGPSSGESYEIAYKLIDLSSSEKCKPLTRACQDSNTLLVCNSSGSRLFKTTCPHGCEAGTCRIFAEDQLVSPYDTCSSSSVINGPFAFVFPWEQALDSNFSGLTGRTFSRSFNLCGLKGSDSEFIKGSLNGQKIVYPRMTLQPYQTMTLYRQGTQELNPNDSQDPKYDFVSAIIAKDCGFESNSCLNGSGQGHYFGPTKALRKDDVDYDGKGAITYKNTSSSEMIIYLMVGPFGDYRSDVKKGDKMLFYVDVQDESCDPSIDTPSCVDTGYGKMKYCSPEGYWKVHMCGTAKCDTNTDECTDGTSPGSAFACFDAKDAFSSSLAPLGTPETVNGSLAAAENLSNPTMASSNSSCQIDAKGRDQVYKVEIPTGHTLKARVISSVSPSESLILYALDSCSDAVNSCSAKVNAGTDLEVENSTGAGKTVYLVVDSESADAKGAFSLTVQID